MTAIQLDPRVVADTLGMDTYELAVGLRGWAIDRLRGQIADLGIEITDHDRLDVFDREVGSARNLLEAAVEAEKAYHEDNPLDETEDA